MDTYHDLIELDSITIGVDDDVSGDTLYNVWLYGKGMMLLFDEEEW